MTFVVLAIRPYHPVKTVTSRPTERTALHVAQNFQSAFAGQCQTKVLAAGTLYCSECGKSENWDSAVACKRPIGSPDDWACDMALSGFAVGKTA